MFLSTPPEINLATRVSVSLLARASSIPLSSINRGRTTREKNSRERTPPGRSSIPCIASRQWRFMHWEEIRSRGSVAEGDAFGQASVIAVEAGWRGRK